MPRRLTVQHGIRSELADRAVWRVTGRFRSPQKLSGTSFAVVGLGPPILTSQPLELGLDQHIPGRRVPDGRRPSAFLDRRGDFRGRINAQCCCVIRTPPRCRDLQHTHVVANTLLRIKLGVGPDGSQLRVADVVGVGCLGDVDRVADWRKFSR